MSEEQKAREDEVFDQELSPDDLDAAAGGFIDLLPPKDSNRSYCVQHEHRPMYGGGGFPNCAATVGRDSNCLSNDGCYNIAVIYDGMRTDCGRTWE